MTRASSACDRTSCASMASCSRSRAAPASRMASRGTYPRPPSGEPAPRASSIGPNSRYAFSTFSISSLLPLVLPAGRIPALRRNHKKGRRRGASAGGPIFPSPRCGRLGGERQGAPSHRRAARGFGEAPDYEIRPVASDPARCRGSDDRVALPFEHAKRARPHGDEVALRVVHLRLGGRRAAGAVHDLALAGYAPLADSPEEVDVHLYGGRPHTHERQHGEAHGVVYEGGVDPAVQGACAVEVVLLDVDADHRAPRLDLLDLGPDVPGEGDLLVKVAGEVVKLLFAQGYCIVAHHALPSAPRSDRSTRW